MTATEIAVYPGVGHTVTSAVSADVQAFLAALRRLGTVLRSGV